jgi:hypothetical protein
MNFHKENPEVTRAYELIKKGKRAEAAAIIAEQGYQDPEQHVRDIEGLIRFQAAQKSTDRRRK